MAKRNESKPATGCTSSAFEVFQPEQELHLGVPRRAGGKSSDANSCLTHALPSLHEVGPSNYRLRINGGQKSTVRNWLEYLR